jgi:hypothetical protein
VPRIPIIESVSYNKHRCNSITETIAAPRLLSRLCFMRTDTTDKAPFFNRLTASIAAGIVVLFVITLYAMGRLPWGPAGIFGFFTANAWSGDTSQMFLDPYSLSHVLHGFAFFYVLFLLRNKIPMHWRVILAILFEVSWEIFENTPFIINRYRTETASLNYFGDSILNSFGDVVSMFVGYWLAARMSWKIILPLFILIELTMLFTIRDNLTLNILMLIYPIPGISEWQQAH